MESKFHFNRRVLCVQLWPFGACVLVWSARWPSYWCWLNLNAVPVIMSRARMLYTSPQFKAKMKSKGTHIGSSEETVSAAVVAVDSGAALVVQFPFVPHHFVPTGLFTGRIVRQLRAPTPTPRPFPRPRASHILVTLGI